MNSVKAPSTGCLKAPTRKPLLFRQPKQQGFGIKTAGFKSALINFEIYTYATLIYLVINMGLIVFMNFLERRFRVPGLMAEGK